jgi:acyl carrier protein
LTSNLRDQVQSIVASHGRLSVDVRTLSDNKDLYRAGMTSHNTLNVMLAVEAHFGFVFPEEMQQRSTFQSVAAICDAVHTLLAEEPVSTVPSDHRD